MTQPLPVNPTPKQEMLSSSNDVKAHRKLIDEPSFRNAIRVAQAEYTRTMCMLAPSSMDSPSQLQASAMCFQRIQGMNDFVSVLLKLGETPKMPTQKQSGNLSHQ